MKRPEERVVLTGIRIASIGAASQFTPNCHGVYERVNLLKVKGIVRFIGELAEFRRGLAGRAFTICKIV